MANLKLPIHEDPHNLSKTRLKSFKLLWEQAEALKGSSLNPEAHWKEVWDNANVPNKHRIAGSTKELPCFNKPQKQWLRVNCLESCMTDAAISYNSGRRNTIHNMTVDSSHKLWTTT